MIQDQVHEATFSPYFFVRHLIFSCIEHSSCILFLSIITMANAKIGHFFLKK